jgi:hypothetical protein
MFDENFWKRLSLITLLLAPIVLFVMTNHEDAAGAYGSGIFFFAIMYGFWELMKDL